IAPRIWPPNWYSLVPGSLQQRDAHHLSVEVYIAVISTLKHQRCRSRCFWKFVRLHPVGKIVVHLRPHSFLSIREYASYYRLPFLRRVGGQYRERETLPYRNCRFHVNSFCYPTCATPLPIVTSPDQGLNTCPKRAMDGVREELLGGCLEY